MDEPARDRDELDASDRRILAVAKEAMDRSDVLARMLDELGPRGESAARAIAKILNDRCKHPDVIRLLSRASASGTAGACQVLKAAMLLNAAAAEGVIIAIRQTGNPMGSDEATKRRSDEGVREWRFVDKSKWGDGPWQNEPDKVQWKDADTGLVCLAVRHYRLGHWCGYVGVPDFHILFQRSHDDVDASVHGGLTSSDFCQENGEEHGICHVPEPGEPDRLWWLGFDCAHAGDVSPGAGWSRMSHDERYRDLDYVRAECRSLASQLATGN